MTDDGEITITQAGLAHLIRDCASHCEPMDANALIATAFQINQVAIGQYYDSDARCGCPAYVAGFVDASENMASWLKLDSERAFHIRDFMQLYDDRMRRSLGTWAQDVVRVTP